MADNGCGFFDATCRANEFLASSIGDALTKTADAVLEAVGKAIAAVGTMWVNVGTPALTGGGGASGVNPGDHAQADGIDTVLGWATYVAFGVCVLSLTWLGVRMGTGRPDGHEHASRLGIVLVATVMVSGAAGLVTAVAPAVRSTGSAPVAFIQDSLWFYMIAVTILSVILGGCRMAWEQRADAGRDLVRSLLTLTVVSAVGITAVSLLTAAGDGFSVWLLNGSLGCDIADPNGTCFGGNMTALLALTSNPATSGGLGPILVILLGVMALLGSLIQVLLMIVRAGMLVLLCGVLPLSAAATNTETGRNMFRKSTGWLLAFILYKPAAAIVYATAFKLTGTSVFKDDGSGLISITTGLTLMAVAILALPALMSLIVPAVSAVASGGGMAAAGVAGAAAMLPTGAVSAGRLFGSGDTGGGDGGDSSGDGGSSSMTSAPSGSAPSGVPAGVPPGAPGDVGTADPSTGSAAGAGPGTAGGAAAGGGAGGAAGGAAAGAAAGPVGAAAGVAQIGRAHV